MNLEFLPALELKRVGDAGEVEGYGSTFGNVDLQGDAVAPGAFTKSLAEHAAAKSMPAMLWSHDPSAPVGTWTAMSEDGHGLKVAGRLTLATQRGAEARALARDGALALSIGFQTRDAVYEKGRRVLKDLKLLEISFCAVPANPLAQLTAIKSALASGTKLDRRTLERALHEILGLPKQFARRLVAGGYSAATDWRDAEGSAVRELAEAVKANTAALESLLRSK